MWKSFCRWLLYRRLRWSVDVTEPRPEKCVVCLAPHTSNWDFIIGQLYNGAEGIHSSFLMKREWFRWPLGVLFRRMGGIPVRRDTHMNMTDALAQMVIERNELHLTITPEGTRKMNADWKLGFYYIALKAGVPILLYGIDYRRKLIQCTRTIIPNGDVEAQVREIKMYYKDFMGKKPENFSIGEQ